jgi:hypothetical protein
VTVQLQLRAARVALATHLRGQTGAARDAWQWDELPQQVSSQATSRCSSLLALLAACPRRGACGAAPRCLFAPRGVRRCSSFLAARRGARRPRYSPHSPSATSEEMKPARSAGARVDQRADGDRCRQARHQGPRAFCETP